jgi:nitrogen-specific signal transduction histidine kinase
VRDVSQRRQLEEQFRQAQKMEAVGRLAGGVAHDFNNLLTVIQGYAEMLLKRLAADPANSRKAAQVVKAAERAAALVEQLLAFSRRQMVEPKVVDVNAAIGDMEKMLRRLIGEDIEFTTRLDPASGSVRVDPGQLDQIVMNLAVNARDAMNASGALTISTSSVLVEDAGESPCAGMPPGRFVAIEVRDTGTGMTQEVLSHIFEPFFTTKPVGKGTGLGLSTVYGVVQQSGGHIDVQSAPGAGSAFRIYLPAVANKGAATEPERIARSCGCKETILVTEDSNSVRDMVAETLRECGYTVLEAIHGRHALEVARQHRGTIDLLLTDVVMPQMGGPELWQNLSPGFPAMKLLFITGYSERDLPPNALFLKKPFSPDVLSQRVRQALH